MGRGGAALVHELAGRIAKNAGKVAALQKAG